MTAERLDIGGAWHVRGRRFPDDRGWFQEWYRQSSLAEVIDFDFFPVQANISHSRAGVVRGIHFSIAPVGQAKLVTVMHGSIDDYVIDIDPGSATFGQWRRIRLTADNGDSVLLPPHAGHAFQALEDGTVVSYLVSAEFNPTAEHGVTPLCPHVGIDWAAGLEAIVSDKDRDAPDLHQQRDAGRLPSR